MLQPLAFENLSFRWRIMWRGSILSFQVWMVEEGGQQHPPFLVILDVEVSIDEWRGRFVSGLTDLLYHEQGLVVGLDLKMLTDEREDIVREGLTAC